jgi:hypothetical protein
MESHVSWNGGRQNQYEVFAHTTLSSSGKHISDSPATDQSGGKSQR